MALSFDGVSDSLSAPVTIPLDKCTVSMWVRQQTLVDGTVFGAYRPPGSYGRTIQVNADGTAACRVWTSTHDVVTFSTATRTAGEWSHLLYRGGANAGGQRLVVNGAAVLNTSQIVSELVDQSAIMIADGKFFSSAGVNLGQKPFAGDLAEFAVWGQELTESEEAVLGDGVSPLTLTNRLGELLFYQDLMVGPDRPGVGPSATVSGAPFVSAHPRVLHPRRSNLSRGAYPRSPAPYLSAEQDLANPTLIAGDAIASGGGY